jgi:hypothetical protein
MCFVLSEILSLEEEEEEGEGEEGWFFTVKVLTCISRKVVHKGHLFQVSTERRKIQICCISSRLVSFQVIL